MMIAYCRYRDIRDFVDILRHMFDTMLKTYVNLLIWNVVTHEAIINYDIKKEEIFLKKFKRYTGFHELLLDLRKTAKPVEELSVDSKKRAGKRRAVDSPTQTEMRNAKRHFQ